VRYLGTFRGPPKGALRPTGWEALTYTIAFQQITDSCHLSFTSFQVLGWSCLLVITLAYLESAADEFSCNGLFFRQTEKASLAQAWELWHHENEKAYCVWKKLFSNTICRHSRELMTLIDRSAELIVLRRSATSWSSRVISLQNF